MIEKPVIGEEIESTEKMSLSEFVDKFKMSRKRIILYEKRKDSFEADLNRFLNQYEEMKMSLAKKLSQVRQLMSKKKSIEEDIKKTQAMIDNREIEQLRSSQRLKKTTKTVHKKHKFTKTLYEKGNIELIPKDKATLYNAKKKLSILKDLFNIKKIDASSNIVFGDPHTGLHNFEFNRDLRSTDNTERFWTEFDKTVERKDFAEIINVLSSIE